MQILKTKFLQSPRKLELPQAFHKYASILNTFYFKVLFILKSYSTEKNNWVFPHSNIVDLVKISINYVRYISILSCEKQFLHACDDMSSDCQACFPMYYGLFASYVQNSPRCTYSSRILILVCVTVVSWRCKYTIRTAVTRTYFTLVVIEYSTRSC